MMFVLGMVAGAAIALVGFVAYMAPKHWDWYHQNVDLRSQLQVAVARAAHYQALVRPNEWGPVEQHEARIVPKVRPYRTDEAIEQMVKYTFDDIRETTDIVAELEAIEKETP